MRREAVSQKIKPLSPCLLDAGLRLVQRESDPGHHTPRPIQCLGRATATENHEIIRVVDHASPETLLVSFGGSVTLTALKCSGAAVTVGSLVVAITVRVIAAGGGVDCAAAELASATAQDSSIPAFLSSMMAPPWILVRRTIRVPIAARNSGQTAVRGNRVNARVGMSCHCEFHTGLPADPSWNETSRYRHGRACPGYPWRQSATTDGRDRPGHYGENDA